MIERKIYVASSWKNKKHLEVVESLRSLGHEVYNFKENDFGFDWGDIHENIENLTMTEYQRVLNDPRVKAAFMEDLKAMRRSDSFVLVMPCGKSAHLELGWAVGREKLTAVLLDPKSPIEPELMVKLCDYVFRDLDLLKILFEEDGPSRLAQYY